MKTPSKLIIFVFIVLTVTASAYAQKPTPTPQMTEVLMARLIKRTFESKKDFVLSSTVCGVLSVCDGVGQGLPAKQISVTVPEGTHLLIVSLSPQSKDIIIVFKHDGRSYHYLTDKSCGLRAAAVWDDSGLRLISNESAAEKFKAEMQFFALVANELPPT